jgi:hypothetical protein
MQVRLGACHRGPRRSSLGAGRDTVCLAYKRHQTTRYPMVKPRPRSRPHPRPPPAARRPPASLEQLPLQHLPQRLDLLLLDSAEVAQLLHERQLAAQHGELCGWAAQGSNGWLV